MAAGTLVAPRPQGREGEAAVDEFEVGKAGQRFQLAKESTDETVVGPKEQVYRSSYDPLPPLSHTNLASFVLENAEGEFAAKTAFVDGSTGESYTYAQMSELVRRAAAGFASLGIGPGDVVLILAPNSPAFAVVYLAVVSLGAVAAPSNPLNTAADISRQLVQVAVKCVVTVPELLSKFGDSIHTLPTILIGDDVAAEIRGSVSFLSEMMDRADYAEVARWESDADETCTLLFSSGTTGVSKAVELTHRNFAAAVAAYNALEPGAATAADDVCLAVIPLYHVYGLGIVFLASLQRGAAVVTMARYSLPAMLQVVERFRVTVATLVPPIYVALVKSAALLESHDLRSLRLLASGAAPLRDDTMAAIQALLPHCVLRQGYGMTEAPLISFSVTASARLQWGSVGPLVPATEARIAHISSGCPLPPNSTGEVWIRGPQVMKGYRNDPEQTAATVDAEGWLHTGDLGFIDHLGYLHVVDRLKEMIKYKAHQVAPGELEAVLLQHPRILDAAVVPFPDEEAGELPMAFVVAREGAELGGAEVMAFVAKLVAPFKKVRKVEFVDAVPKSATGKILRKELVRRIHERLRSAPTCPQV